MIDHVINPRVRVPKIGAWIVVGHLLAKRCGISPAIASLLRKERPDRRGSLRSKIARRVCFLCLSGGIVRSDGSRTTELIAIGLPRRYLTSRPFSRNLQHEAPFDSNPRHRRCDSRVRHRRADLVVARETAHIRSSAGTGAHDGTASPGGTTAGQTGGPAHGDRAGGSRSGRLRGSSHSRSARRVHTQAMRCPLRLVLRSERRPMHSTGKTGRSLQRGRRMHPPVSAPLWCCGGPDLGRRGALNGFQKVWPAVKYAPMGRASGDHATSPRTTKASPC